MEKNSEVDKEVRSGIVPKEFWHKIPANSAIEVFMKDPRMSYPYCQILRGYFLAADKNSVCIINDDECRIMNRNHGLTIPEQIKVLKFA